MYRRVVSLMLLPCVLLTQLAAIVGHAHAGQHPSGHEFRPHIHTQPASHDHGHRHKHSHEHPRGTGEDHQHHDEEGAREPGAPTAPSPEPLSPHDSDAFYVVGVDALVGGRSVAGLDCDTSSLWVAPAESGFALRCLNSSPQWQHCWHTPPVNSCPLYVRHLTLLL